MTRRGGPDHKPQSSAWQGQVGPSPPFSEAAASLPPGCPPQREYAIVPPGLHDSARTTPGTSGYTKIGDHWGLSRVEGCAATAEHGGTGQVPGYPGRVPTSWTGSQAQLRSRAGFLAAAAWTCPGWDAEQQPGSRPTDAAATSTPAPTSGQNCPMRIAGVEGLPLAPCHNAH